MAEESQRTRHKKGRNISVCEAPVTLKTGTIKTAHFSHHRIIDCIRFLYKRESLQHLEAKHDLYQALGRRHRVSMEHHLPEIEQIPDLLVGKRALEIQYSAISPARITERSKDTIPSAWMSSGFLMRRPLMRRP